jgi:hypothetical protein
MSLSLSLSLSLELKQNLGGHKFLDSREVEKKF